MMRSLYSTRCLSISRNDRSAALGSRGRRVGPLLTVGSSGLEHHALVHAWKEAGRIDREEQLYRKQEPVDRLLLMSGSASPTTAAQIDWAIEHGFCEVRLNTEGLVDSDAATKAREVAVEKAVDVLTAGTECRSLLSPRSG